MFDGSSQAGAQLQAGNYSMRLQATFICDVLVWSLSIKALVYSISLPIKTTSIFLNILLYDITKLETLFLLVL